MKIVQLKTEKAKQILEIVRERGDHCACVPTYSFSPDNICPCKEFLESKEIGECHCGLYRKEEI